MQLLSTSSRSTRGKASRVIKRLLGIEQLEQEYRQLTQYMSDLIRCLRVLEQEEARIWKAIQALQTELSHHHEKWQDQAVRLDGKLRALGGKLDQKVNLEDFDQISTKVKDLLQHCGNVAFPYCNSRCNSQEELLQHPTDPAKGIHKFPPALKKLVTVLFDAEEPLSYAQVARKIEKDPSTARSYIHRLRERGFPLQFHESFGGQKRVSLPLAIRRQLAIPG